MRPLHRSDLLSLEQYAEQRPAFRQRLLAHKRPRRVPLGEHAALYFEDRLTVQYQVQEMLRIERIFEPEAIEAELAAYNPLIPDGRNWKATLMLEFPDPEERRARLAELVGVERALWLRVEGFEPIHPIANEDLERSTAEKTSAVHFLRFELSAEMIAALKSGAGLRAGCDHPAMSPEVDVAEASRVALLADLA